MLPDFTHRADLSELMDDPDCDEAKLLRTIGQFSSINRLLSRYPTILKRWVLADMLKDPDKKYHLVDMGAGGCDIDAWLLKSARKHGLDLRISACDIDPRIIGYAQSTYGHRPGLHIRKMNLFSDSFSEPVDYIFANHFLHHLTGEQITRLIARWQPQVRRRMVFSDLLRNPFAYLAFSVFALPYRHSFTRPDGLTSIRRGFLPHELAEITRSACPDTPFSIHSVHPGRLTLCIDGTTMGNA